MRKLVIGSALICAALAAPAQARDGAAYLGVDGGITKAQSLDLRYVSSTASISDAERIRHKWGYDVDGVFGYDFGMFRVEAELGYKRSKLKSASLNPAALAAVLLPNAATSVDASGHASVLTGMVNTFLDLGPSDGMNGSIGIGAGEARAKYRAGLIPSSTLNFTSEDSAFAWQALAEVRVPVSDNIDVGLKYRYFQTQKLRFGPFCTTTCTAIAPFHLNGRYKSNSLLASLLFNFGGSRAAPLPPAPPPPPPPPAPATQTCPDGTVIPATATCPAPPPPPPPPPPPVQRGERGE